MTLVREFRAFHPLEVRAAADGGVKVGGYAAVFNEETNVADMFIEVLAPGAFTETLKRKAVKGATDDVIFVINHNSNMLLARTRSGTLQLAEDSKGLIMESVLDEVDPDAIRVVQKMKRGDLDKMSFAFRATKQEWAEVPDQLPRRSIIEAELFDVSVVTEPQYSGTDIGLRGLQDFKPELLPNPDIAIRAAQARLRMKAGLFARRSS